MCDFLPLYHCRVQRRTLPSKISQSSWVRLVGWRRPMAACWRATKTATSMWRRPRLWCMKMRYNTAVACFSVVTWPQRCHYALGDPAPDWSIQNFTLCSRICRTAWSGWTWKTMKHAMNWRVPSRRSIDWFWYGLQSLETRWAKTHFKRMFNGRKTSSFIYSEHQLTW